MDQGNAIAGTVDGRLHKAALATNLDDMIDIDFIAHLEREAGGNGNARLGVQELRDLLVGTAGAGKHARGRVGDTQGLHAPCMAPSSPPAPCMAINATSKPPVAMVTIKSSAAVSSSSTEV